MQSKSILKTFSVALGGLLSAISWMMYMVTYILFQAEAVFAGNNQIKLATFLFLLVIPLVSLVTMVQLKIIDDIDTRDKKKRILMMMVFLSCNLILIAIALSSGFYDLAKLLLLPVIPGILVTLINKFWLLSIHTSTSAVSVTAMAYLSGWPYHLLFVLVLLVAWARVYEKKHTFAQVLTGGVLGILICYGLLTLFFTPGQFS